MMMLRSSSSRGHVQTGFSLVELMVGLVIGLLATLAIMQVFSVFEGQKRSTSSTGDAQTNGSIALMNIQRDLNSAGYGLPLPIAYDGLNKDHSPLLCDDGDILKAPTALNVELMPVQILDGDDNSNDELIVRYSTTAMSAAPVNIIDSAQYDEPTAGLIADNNLGIVLYPNEMAPAPAKNIAVISKDGECLMSSVTAVNGINQISFVSVPGATGNVGALEPGGKVSFMGDWQSYQYKIDDNNQLVRNTDANDKPIVSEIVALQAQYGISATPDENQVVQWVNATAPWDDPSVEQRNRIKAVRVVVVARNNLREKEKIQANVDGCVTSGGVMNYGPCAWDDAGVEQAPVIDLRDLGDDWEYYRYRSYETIIPLRNMIWSREALS